jgi:glucose-1-phosphate adenylyltransferase
MKERATPFIRMCFYCNNNKPDRTLVLSGDHIYRMDYRELLAYHVQKNAEVTIASIEYPSEKATGFGVMQMDEEGRVLNFVEKSPHPPEIPGKPGWSLVNMGVYIFNTPCLVRSVVDDHKNVDTHYDLGQNVLPHLVKEGNVPVYAYPFSLQQESSYWRDVGSIASYFQASMDMLEPSPPLDLFSKEWPFRSALIQLPPCQINRSGRRENTVARSLVSGGCCIDGVLDRCILSPGVKIGEGSVLEGCIVFNEASIGRKCRIQRTIIDKNAIVPDGCTIGFNPEIDRQQFMVTEERIVVIPKGMVVEKSV